MKTLELKFLLLVAIVLLLSVVAGAQQSTPYSTSIFSATFNGSVETSTTSNARSNNSIYQSSSHGVIQAVVVRTVDHNIAVDQVSSDFYANDDRTGGETSDVTRDYYHGHPFTYTYHVFVFNGVKSSKRTRFIIVNARTIIFIFQISAASYEDRSEWETFVKTLDIK